MPRTCTVCHHPDREAIDQALREEEPYRSITERFGPSISALSRHKAHLRTHRNLAADPEELASTERLLRQVDDLAGQALAVVEQARAAGDLPRAATALRQAEGAVARLHALRLEVQRYVTLPEFAWFLHQIRLLGVRCVLDDHLQHHFEERLAELERAVRPRSGAERRNERRREEARRVVRRSLRRLAETGGDES